MANSKIVGLLLGALTLTFSTVALADWNQTFEAGPVSSYMAQADAKYVVIPSGDSGKSVTAAKSLEAALRAGAAAMVMDGASLGDVSGLDDAAIVAKAKNLPADHIVIVRVFEASGDASDSVVVMVYDKAGETRWALSGTEGLPLAANTKNQGVPVAARKSVADVTASTNAIDEDARDKFDEEFIWFADYVGVNNQTGAVMGSWTETYQGKYKKPLQGEAFYHAVGRPDLAEDYNSNQKRHFVGLGVAAVGVVGLVGFGMLALLNSVPTSDFDPVTLEETEREKDVTTPLILSGASLGVLIAGILVLPSSVHPVELSEAKKLADEQNKKLRRELDLPENYMPFASPGATQGAKFNFSIKGNGAQLRLQYDF